MYNPNIKTEIINNIIFTMSDYLDNTTLDILQKVIREQLVAVNMEEITTLPAELQTSTEEQNRYFISLMLIKKRNLAKETKQQYRDAVMRLLSVIDKPLNKVDENDIDVYLTWYEQRNVAAGRRRSKNFGKDAKAFGTGQSLKFYEVQGPGWERFRRSTGKTWIGRQGTL